MDIFFIKIVYWTVKILKLVASIIIHGDGDVNIDELDDTG